MLDTNENDLKLLKMKEKLLEVTDANHEENLRVYAELARQIDSDYYYSIINKIKESNYHNQTLEEELVFLEELEKEYEQLTELQCRFKDTYEKHSFRDLDLSDISSIDIDTIRNRKSVISGYLINLKNIENNKKDLEECNEQLILEEKKKKEIEKRFGVLEEELKKSFLSAEGRVYSKETNSIGYTSVVNEYKNNDIDAVSLLDNEELLTEMLKQADDNRNEKEEVLSTALICYDNLPNKENKEILNSINIEAVQARYKLVLFKMLNLIAKKMFSYDQVKTKREELIDLIKYRKTCLEQLGIKFSIDPFSRIKIEEQLKFIGELGNNSKEITRIRRYMADISDKLDEMTVMNDEFLQMISNKIELIRDNLSMSSIDISLVDDVELTPVIEEIQSETVEYADNQVVSIGDISVDFNLERAVEKSDGVIKRVIEMINGSHITDSNSQEMIPELVVENVDSTDYDFEESSVFDEPIFELSNQENIFQESSVANSWFDDNKKDVDFESDKVVTEGDETLDSNDDKKTDDDVSELPISSDKEDDKSDEINIFQNITPFEETKLFEDRLDEEIEEETISFDDEMPEAFWITQNDNIDTEDEVISFDEQIDRLLSNDDNDSKVKRLVA